MITSTDIFCCGSIEELTALVPAVANADIESELAAHIKRTVPACPDDHERYDDRFRDQWVLCALQAYALRCIQ